MPWGNLDTQDDFYSSFIRPLMDSEKMKQNRLETQHMQTRNQYQGPTLEQELMGKQLGNQFQTMQNQQMQESMPYNIPTLEASLAGKLLGNQQKQFEVQSAPQEFAMKQQAHAMAQAVKNMQMQKYQAEISNLMNPGNAQLKAPGVPGQLAWADKLEAEGKPEDAKIIRDELTKNSSAFKAWQSMHPNDRNAVTAKIRGMGVDEVEGIRRIVSGESINQIGASIGLTPEQVEAKGRSYVAGQAIITKMMNQVSAGETSKVFHKYIQENAAPYSGSGWEKTLLGGHSMPQLLEKIRNENPEDDRAVGRFVAAYKARPELAGERAREVGLTALGIEGIKHLESSLPYDTKPIESLLTEYDQQVSSEELDKLFRDASIVGAYTLTNPQSFFGNISENYEQIAKEYGLNEHEVEDLKSFEESNIDAEIAALKRELGENHE